MRFFMVLAAAAALTSPALAQSNGSMMNGTTHGMSNGSMTMPKCGSGNPIVWLNTDSNVYFKRSSAYYGKTKQGRYVCRNTAQSMGAHKAKSGTMGHSHTMHDSSDSMSH